MSSPQKSDSKENNLDKKILDNCLINQNLNKILKNKSLQQAVFEKENFIKKNIEINSNIMLQQQQQGQQQTLFENMIKHCGLVEELGMYSEDQYDGQQLDSSSASSKTEEMPVSEISQNPVSPHSESGSIGINSVNNEVQLNLSQNSSVGSGRASVNSNANGNANNILIKNENQLQNDLLKIQNNSPLTPTTVGNLNVNSLLNSVSVANALNNINSSTNNVNAATAAAAAAAAVAAQQQLSVAAASNNSNLLSELSALVAANNNSTNQNDLANSSSKNNGNNMNTNSLASLNGLGLLNNLGNLTNSLPINQLASLLAGNNANAAVNQQHQMLLQANNLAKLSGFNMNTNEIHDHLQQLQQLQQNLQQILILNQLNQQQQQPNLSALNSIAPLGQMLSSLPQNLQSLLQNSNLLNAQNLLNSPLNQQSQQNNRPSSTGSNSNLNIPQFLQQLQDATSQALQQTNNTTNQNQANILNGSNLLSSLSSNCGQNVSSLLKNPLHNENINNKSSLLKNKDLQRSNLNSKINDSSSINLTNLSQHLLAKNSQNMNGSSNNFNSHQNNNNTVAAALANHLQNSSMDCESSNVFDKLQNNSSKSNCNINNNNTVANALLQQHQKQQNSLQSNSQNSNNNLIINVQQQLRQLSQNQQLGNFIPNVKQLSPQFENNSNHSNFSNSSSTNSKLNQQSNLANSTQNRLSSSLNNELSSGNMNMLNNMSSAQSNGSDQEVKNLEELEQFAKYFKQRRIKMGYTQGDVGLAMGRRYGNEFSQTTISRFEALNLSFKNMLKLRPMLERWLHDTETLAGASNGGSLNVNNPIANGQTINNNQLSNNQTHAQNNCVPSLMSSGIESMCKRRKKRTSIETSLRQELEKAFDCNQKPTFDEIAVLADKLNMEKEVVRVWFCNRRQKQRKTNFNGDCAMLASLNEFGQLRQMGSPSMSDDGMSDQQFQKMANRFELVRSGLNLALSSPSPPSTPQQFTVVSPGSPDSQMNVDHSLPPSPVSSRKYSIRQGSFS